MLFCEAENKELFRLAAFKYSSELIDEDALAVIVVGTLFFHSLKLVEPVLETVINPIGPPVTRLPVSTLLAELDISVGEIKIADPDSIPVEPVTAPIANPPDTGVSYDK
tara:strand:+ start:1603 stop:1929 length:327 start_codon:yes stop_codon:yes gene_type:complete